MKRASMPTSVSTSRTWTRRPSESETRQPPQGACVNFCRTETDLRRTETGLCCSSVQSSSSFLLVICTHPLPGVLLVGGLVALEVVSFLRGAGEVFVARGAPPSAALHQRQEGRAQVQRSSLGLAAAVPWPSLRAAVMGKSVVVCSFAHHQGNVLAPLNLIGSCFGNIPALLT
eukprot:1180801-Prorocentrum_minimum.AAC.3